MKRMAQLTVFWIGCFALSIYGMKDITLLDNQCLLGSQNFKKSIKGASIKACYNFVADIIDGGQFSTEVKFKSILWWLPGKCKVSKLMVAGILESKEQVGNILQEVAVGKKKLEKKSSEESIKKIIKKEENLTRLILESVGKYTTGKVLYSLKKNKKKASKTIVTQMITGQKQIVATSILEKCVGFIIGKCTKNIEEWKTFFGMLAKKTYDKEKK